MKNVLRLFLFCMLIGAGSANAAFLGMYDVNNWTKIGAAGAGTVTSTSPSKVIMQTSDAGNGWTGERFVISAPKSGTVSFSWDYDSFDTRGSGSDRFGIWLNGLFTLLSDVGRKAANVQHGVYSFAVSQGDRFGFRMTSQDSSHGFAKVEITNFNAPMSIVPLPAAAWLMIAPLAGVLSRKKKANSTNVRFA